MRETCTKRIFSEPRALIKLEPRDEISRENYDCSFKIHLPVGNKISVKISALTNHSKYEVNFFKVFFNLSKYCFWDRIFFPETN